MGEELCVRVGGAMWRRDCVVGRSYVYRWEGLCNGG